MRSECVIVGGGPAGCVLGIRLARAGRDVVLLEKEARAHDKVCGEFLSGEALSYLRDLAVDVDAHGAVPISTVRLIRGETVRESRLPFAARSLSRRRLDELLLRRASEAGVQVRRGRAVESVSGARGAWQIRLAAAPSGEELIEAREAFLASGKHDVRGWKRPPGAQNDLIAFKLHWRLTSENTRALEDCVELVLFPGGYCGLELVEDGVTNLCLLVRRAAFARAGKSWLSLLETIERSSPHLRRRLEGAAPLWPAPLAVSSIPYGHMQGQAGGPWRVGDQFAVIPSFCGDGIALALHGAALLAASYLAGEQEEAWRRKMASQVRRQVSLASAISRALVRAPGQRAAISALGLWPAALARVASATRIAPEHWT